MDFSRGAMLSTSEVEFVILTERNNVDARKINDERDLPWESWSLKSPRAFRRPARRVAWNILMSSSADIEFGDDSAVLLSFFGTVLILPIVGWNLVSGNVIDTGENKTEMEY